MGPRKPESVYGVGNEPDPRFSLANERTFLAWVHTSLALVAGAVALHSLKVPDTVWVRKALVIVLLVLSAFFAVTASVRWRRTERAMRLNEPLPALWQVDLIGLSVVALATLLAVAFAVL